MSPLAHAYVEGTGLFLEPGVSIFTVGSNIYYGGTAAGNSSGRQSVGSALIGRAKRSVYESFFVAADARYVLPLMAKTMAMAIRQTPIVGHRSPVIGMQMPDWGSRVFVCYVLVEIWIPKVPPITM